MNQRRNLTVFYCAIHAAFWMNYVGLLGFASVYLLDIGLNSSVIGILIAVSSLLSALIQPPVAAYADKPKSVSVRTIALIAVAVCFFGGLMMALTFKRSIFWSAIFFGLSALAMRFQLPYINSLATEMINQGYSVNFGIARGIGSISFAVNSALFGMISTRIGTITLPLCTMASSVLLTVMILLYPFQKDPNKGKNQEALKQENASRPGAFFKKYPKLTVVLAGCLLVYTMQGFLASFFYQVVQAKGGDPGILGNLMSVGAIAEIPTLVFYGLLLRKAKSDTWFRVCTFAMACKVFYMIFVPTAEFLYAAQVMQMLGWALMSIAPIYYINEVTAPEDKIKGQAYLAAAEVYGSVIASIIGGILIDSAGITVMLVAAASVGFLGAAAVFFYTERFRKAKPS